MNARMQDLLYESGLTAQGCWDQMPEYDRSAIEKFAQLIVQACAEICLEANDHENILRHFVVNHETLKI
jgi:uncharacterized protein YutE (UPF0331/DUF86 family)